MHKKRLWLFSPSSSSPVSFSWELCLRACLLLFTLGSITISACLRCAAGVVACSLVVLCYCPQESGGLAGLLGIFCVWVITLVACAVPLCAALKWLILFLSDFVLVEASKNVEVVFKMLCFILRLLPQKSSSVFWRCVIVLNAPPYREKKTCFQKRVILIKCSKGSQAHCSHAVSVSAVFMLSVQLDLCSQFCSCVVSLDICVNSKTLWSYRLRASTRPTFADLIAELGPVFLKSCCI